MIYYLVSMQVVFYVDCHVHGRIDIFHKYLSPSIHIDNPLLLFLLYIEVFLKKQKYINLLEDDSLLQPPSINHNLGLENVLKNKKSCRTRLQKNFSDIFKLCF